MSDPYSRLYHRFAEEFPDVWANDRALATWVRLLRIADASWPMKPPLPRSVRPGPLAVLVGVELVTVLGDCYTVRGLDAERSRRKDAAAHAAALRWHSNGTADAMPKTAREEKSTNKAQPHSADADDDGRDDLEAFLLITRRAPTPKQRKLLDDILATRDVSGPQWAAQIMLRHPDDPIGAVIAEDKAWRAGRIEAAKTQERKPPRRPHRSTGLTGVNAELAKYYRDLETERKPEVEEVAS